MAKSRKRKGLGSLWPDERKFSSFAVGECFQTTSGNVWRKIGPSKAVHVRVVRDARYPLERKRGDLETIDAIELVFPVKCGRRAVFR